MFQAIMPMPDISVCQCTVFLVVIVEKLFKKEYPILLSTLNTYA